MDWVFPRIIICLGFSLSHLKTLNISSLSSPHRFLVSYIVWFKGIYWIHYKQNVYKTNMSMYAQTDISEDNATLCTNPPGRKQGVNKLSHCIIRISPQPAHLQRPISSHHPPSMYSQSHSPRISLHKCAQYKNGTCLFAIGLQLHVHNMELCT